MNFKYIKILVSSVLIMTAQFASPQSSDIKEADICFNNFNYQKAIEVYKQYLKENNKAYYSTKQIAKSYSKMGDSDQAVLWYKRCLDFTEKESDIYLFLAQEELRTNNIKKAAEHFDKYYEYTKIPPQLVSLSYFDYYNYLTRDSFRYQISTLKLNTEYDEFGPAFYNNKIVFTSNRPDNDIIHHKDIQTNKNFLNLYVGDGSQSKAELFSTEMQTNLNNGPVFFSSDLKIAYLTSNVGNNK